MAHISYAGIRNVRPDEANLYRNKQTGFQFELVGDGKLEPQVQDVVSKAFPDSQVTDDIASLQTFVARHAKLAAASVVSPDAPPLDDAGFAARKTEVFAKLDSAAENCLGEGWHLQPDGTSYNGQLNYATYARENGPVEQEIRLTPNYREAQIETVFSTTIPGQGKQFTSLTQDIQFLADAGTGAFRPDSLQESAMFKFA